MGWGRSGWRGEEGEKNEDLKVQWRTKVTKWQCLTATSILKWSPSVMPCSQVLIFFSSSFGTQKGKKKLIVPLLAPELWLLAIEVNAGTTLITMSHSSSARIVCGWSITDWSLCSAGSLSISTHKPLSSAKTLSSPRHICLHLPQSFSPCLQLGFKVTPHEKSYLLKPSCVGEK